MDSITDPLAPTLKKNQQSPQSKPGKKKRVNVWRFIYLVLLFGFIFIGASGTQVIIWNGTFAQNFFTYLNVLGTLLLVAGGCYFAGGLIGFLFGIPRMFQNPTTLQQRAISQNDNLVQISDWITKIIVGVGLTQLYNIPHFLMKTGTELGKSFGTVGPEGIDKGRNIAIVTILYFSIIGFLSVYLWTRLYFTKMLNRLEIDLNDEVKKDIEALKKSTNELQENSTDMGGGKTLTQEKLQQIKGSNIATDKEISTEEYHADPQKGKWGGKPEANDRKMSATIVPSTITNFYVVTITVISTNPNNPLTGYVKFHLHNTFKNQSPVITVQENKAELRLNMVYGAFTVGAELDEGKTNLELDLAELPGAPEEFRNR